MYALRSALQTRFRALWRAYRRVPRPIRWPLTAIALVFAAVIVTNLFFSFNRTVERTFLIPPGEFRIVEVQVDPGRGSEVRWEIGSRDVAAAGFPLRVRLTGPDEAQESLAGPGEFRFKGGFTTAQYRLELLNQAPEANAAVDVRWVVR